MFVAYSISELAPIKGHVTSSALEVLNSINYPYMLDLLVST